MKKLLLVVLAFIGMQVSAQDLNSVSASASKESSSMVEKLATDQVSKLTKKLNLNESQQKMATEVVAKQLRSEKFRDLVNDSASKMVGSKSNQSEMITKALLGEPKFQKEMTGVLDEKQEQTFNKMIPRE